MPVARPEPEIAATAEFKEFHVTELVMFCVLASVKVPVAVNCWVAPFTIAGFAGVTAMEVSVAAEIVSTVEPVTGPDVAWIVETPVPTPFARPPLEIVATLVVSDTQVTEFVMFCVEPSLYVPVAAN